jgi:hypothetical protein
MLPSVKIYIDISNTDLDPGAKFNANPSGSETLKSGTVL